MCNLINIHTHTHTQIIALKQFNTIPYLIQYRVTDCTVHTDTGGLCAECLRQLGTAVCHEISWRAVLVLLGTVRFFRHFFPMAYQ